MSELDRVISKTWDRNLLFSVLLELTYRCNLDCFFCYNDLSLAGEPLSRERYLELLHELRDMNVMMLTLSGGEPLAHPDFFLLGKSARELGFVVKVKSNGHALGGELARRLKDEIDPWIVETSLHGACAETHERQTRVVGSFERLLRNVRELRELGINVKINSTLTNWNEGEIEGMFDLADELGCPLTVDPVVTPRDDGSREPQAIQASNEGLRRLVEVRARHAARSTPPPVASPAAPARVEPTAAAAPAEAARLKNCGAGSAIIAVDPFGNVYPCVNWRRPAGNLHEKTMSEIWFGSQALAEVRELTVDVAKAANAAMPGGREAVGFCPGFAEASLGSPTAIYPAWKRVVDLEAQTAAKER